MEVPIHLSSPSGKPKQLVICSATSFFIAISSMYCFESLYNPPSSAFVSPHFYIHAGDFQIVKFHVSCNGNVGDFCCLRFCFILLDSGQFPCSLESLSAIKDCKGKCWQLNMEVNTDTLTYVCLNDTN